MTNASEKVWVSDMGDGAFYVRPWFDATEYTRSDIADILRAEVARLQGDCFMLWALHAGRQGQSAGYKSGHIGAHYYDQMKALGGYMDQFTRVDDGTDKPALAHGEADQ
jgi:hypothetical protein